MVKLRDPSLISKLVQHARHAAPTPFRTNIGKEINYLVAIPSDVGEGDHVVRRDEGPQGISRPERLQLDDVCFMDCPFSSVFSIWIMMLESPSAMTGSQPSSTAS